MYISDELILIGSNKQVVLTITGVFCNSMMRILNI